MTDRKEVHVLKWIEQHQSCVWMYSWTDEWFNLLDFFSLRFTHQSIHPQPVSNIIQQRVFILYTYFCLKMFANGQQFPSSLAMAGYGYVFSFLLLYCDIKLLLGRSIILYKSRYMAWLRSIHVYVFIYTMHIYNREEGN